MRKPIGITVPYREFNKVERQQTLITESKESRLIAEVAMLTEMVRVLAARVEELEKK